MSEYRAIYGVDGANTANAVPEPGRAIYHLIEKSLVRPPISDNAKVLLQCLASALHPDYLFNLAMLSALPNDHKEAALELIEFSLISGFTLDEKAQLLRLVEPLMATALGSPRNT